MGKLSRDELVNLREQKRAELGIGEADASRSYVLVGMGTSGVAAGARLTFAALRTELEFHGLTDVVLKQTGSLGLDHAEPTVEVRMPGMPPVIYGKVDPTVAAKIVRKHLLEKSLVNAHVFDRPAVEFDRGRKPAAREAK